MSASGLTLFYFPFDSIHHMQENGLVGKWTKKWWERPSHCLYPPDETAQSLGLDSLGGLFLSYTCIIALACLCLLLEIAQQANAHRSRVECDTEISAEFTSHAHGFCKSV